MGVVGLRTAQTLWSDMSPMCYRRLALDEMACRAREEWRRVAEDVHMQVAGLALTGAQAGKGPLHPPLTFDWCSTPLPLWRREVMVCEEPDLIASRPRLLVTYPSSGDDGHGIWTERLPRRDARSYSSYSPGVTCLDGTTYAETSPAYAPCATRDDRPERAAQRESSLSFNVGWNRNATRGLHQIFLSPHVKRSS
ncbi:hypothetical protein EJ03DRAFT_182365 [Teratosphaeria nubilosa]|uniref:Uncharacterized protein n=1 Tax=Teratosphaeria nubilosa TaxID=161662 RepID=A0A6G1L036_9PEZI|nr:hypothetical protein EJ03DRAFT_182365 [Teratosphaeria nubilosa]